MVTKTETYHVSKTINAPLRFVYEWCTDFRDDDPQLTGSKSKRRVVEKAKNRAIYLVDYKQGRKKLWHASVITLQPPKAWHLETAGDLYETEIGDYKLSSLGKSKSRLDMTFTVNYHNTPYKIDSKKDWEDDTGKFWDKLIEALDRDYASGS